MFYPWIGRNHNITIGLFQFLPDKHVNFILCQKMNLVNQWIQPSHGPAVIRMWVLLIAKGLFTAISSGTTIITAASRTISRTATVKVFSPPELIKNNCFNHLQHLLNLGKPKISWHHQEINMISR